MKSPRIFYLLLFVLLLVARLCHVDALWAEETLPLAAAEQMLHGKALYRDIWFDKPPLLAATYLMWGARDGVALRLAGALYALLACWIGWRFAGELWGRREAYWAASLLAFFLVFDFPSSVTPLASDLLMVAPHLAAVWLTWRKRPFWAGVLCGVAFLMNPKGAFVLLACYLWNWRAFPLLLAGFAFSNAIATAWLWATGALGGYLEQVWRWGLVYATQTFVDHPVRNGALRSAHWLGFHAALVIPTVWLWWRYPRAEQARWALWLLVSFAALAAGWRFFPRYYFAVLPVFVLAAARGLTLLGRRRAMAIAILLLVPLTRFGPSYAHVARDRDLVMDRDSREAARFVRQHSAPGDTLFVWGFRPELYVYTKLPAASRYLDSQPLTGVPADRHLGQSQPVDIASTRARRAELATTKPTVIIDGLGPFNPRLAISQFEDLHPWLSDYREIARTSLTIIYKRHHD